MAMETQEGLRWLERVEEAGVLGKVQAMLAEEVKLPDRLLRGFRAMLVLLKQFPPSLQAASYYLRAVLNAAVGFQAMHLPEWRK